MYINWKEEKLNKESIPNIGYGTLIKYNNKYCIMTEYGDRYSDPDHIAETKNKVLAINIIDGTLVWIDIDEEVIVLKSGKDYTLEIAE